MIRETFNRRTAHVIACPESDLPQALGLLREDLRLSQRQVARHMDRAGATVCMLEQRDLGGWLIRDLRKYAEAVGLVVEIRVRRK